MRLAGHLARASGAAIVFVLAAVGGLLAHRNLPTVRRTILVRVNAALEKVLPGRIVIQKLDSLDLDRVSGVDATISDPTGVDVLQVHGLTARIDTLGLLRSLGSTGPLAIDLSEVVAQSADVSLEPAPEGPLRVVRACVPDKPTAPSPAARQVRLEIPQARVDHVTVHGSPLPVLPLDVDVSSLDAMVRVAPGSLVLDLAHADVTARGLPSGTTTHGSVQGHLEQPAAHGGERSARVSWQGTVGAIPTTALFILDGSSVYAVVDAPSIQPADLTALWPQSPLGEPGSAHVEAVGMLPTLIVSARVSAGSSTVEASGPVVLSDTRLASLAFEATSFDARVASPQAPETRLDAHGVVLLAATAAGAVGAVTATSVTGLRSVTCIRMVPGRRRARVASEIQGSASTLERAASRSAAKTLAPRARPLSATMSAVVRRSVPTTAISVIAKRGLCITCRRAVHARPTDAPVTRATPATARSTARTRLHRPVLRVSPPGGVCAGETGGSPSRATGTRFLTRRLPGVIAPAPEAFPGARVRSR